MMKLNPEIPIKMLIPIENTLALTREFITFPRYAVTFAIIPRPRPIKLSIRLLLRDRLNRI